MPKFDVDYSKNEGEIALAKMVNGNPYSGFMKSGSNPDPLSG